MKGDILTKIENSIEISASPEKVWPMIQWDKIPEWYAPWKKIEWTSKDNRKVGSAVRINVKIASMKAKSDYETAEFIENEKVVRRSTGGREKPQGFVLSVPQKMELK